MFDNRTDPVHLISSLEQFMNQWCHPSRRGWFGIDKDKLAAAQLPEPLRQLYSFAGNWPGHNYLRSIFANQDWLNPFELLSTQDGRLVFGHEAQGVALFATEQSGQDPPVWISVDDAPWEKKCDSLAQFLVTMCLSEIAHSGEFKARHDDILGYCRSRNFQISPLWMNGPYFFGPLDIYLVESNLLVVVKDKNWEHASTNWDSFPERAPELFDTNSGVTQPPMSSEDLIRNPTVPKCVREQFTRNLVRSHREQATFHADRAEAYQKFLDELESSDEPWI